MTVTKIDKAKAQIVLDHPFFASLLLRKPLIETDRVPTAAVDARGQVYYNPKFTDKLSVSQLVFLFCHEIGHVIAQHALRRGERDPKKWNKAGDAWINDMLNDAGVGEFIEGGVNMPGSKDKTTDQIYNEMPDDDGGGGGGQGPGGIGEDLLEGEGGMSEEERQQIEAETKIAIAQAAQAAKVIGKMPGSLAKIVADILHVPTPWYDILERYMVALTSGEYTWKRPNRRFSDHYLPSTGSVATMGDVALIIDISGSISKQELNYYNGHMQRIVEQCNPERVHVMYVDTDVHKYEVFERGTEFALNFYSGGGTDMEAGFDFMAKQGINADVCVVLTDGYTSFDDNRKPDCPVVWCISSSVEAPYGETIHFEMER